MTFVFLSEDGVNPQEIIDIIARDSSQGIFKKVFEDIAGNINQGYSLAEAFDETNFSLQILSQFCVWVKLQANFLPRCADIWST